MNSRSENSIEVGKKITFNDFSQIYKNLEQSCEFANYIHDGKLNEETCRDLTSFEVSIIETYLAAEPWNKTISDFYTIRDVHILHSMTALQKACNPLYPYVLHRDPIDTLPLNMDELNVRIQNQLEYLESLSVFDIDAKDANGNTALMIACYGPYQNLPIVKKLISMGADMDYKNKKGHTCFSIAEDSGNDELVEYIFSFFHLNLNRIGIWHTVYSGTLNRMFNMCMEDFNPKVLLYALKRNHPRFYDLLDLGLKQNEHLAIIAVMKEYCDPMDFPMDKMHLESVDTLNWVIPTFMKTYINVKLSLCAFVSYLIDSDLENDKLLLDWMLCYAFKSIHPWVGLKRIVCTDDFQYHEILSDLASGYNEKDSYEVVVQKLVGDLKRNFPEAPMSKIFNFIESGFDTSLDKRHMVKGKDSHDNPLRSSAEFIAIFSAIKDELLQPTIDADPIITRFSNICSGLNGDSLICLANVIAKRDSSSKLSGILVEKAIHKIIIA